MTSYQANKVRSEYSRSVYYIVNLVGIINDSLKKYFVLSEKNRVLLSGFLVLAVVVKEGIDRHFDESDTEEQIVED